MSKKKGFLGLLTGIGIGLGIGVILAPKDGSTTRKELKNKIDNLFEKLQSLDSNDLKDSIVVKLKKLESELEELDREKALDLAKKKASEIKNKLDEICQDVSVKSKPLVDKAADELRDSAVKVLKEIIKKIETEEKPKVKKLNAKKNTSA